MAEQNRKCCADMRMQEIERRIKRTIVRQRSQHESKLRSSLMESFAKLGVVLQKLPTWCCVTSISSDLDYENDNMGFRLTVQITRENKDLRSVFPGATIAECSGWSTWFVEIDGSIVIRQFLSDGRTEALEASE